MSGVKISALPAASAANDSDQVEVNQAGTTRRLTLDQVATLVASLGGAGPAIGPAPPAVPAPNSLWWNSDNGQLFIRYDDGNSIQWVPATPAASATSGTVSPLQFGAVGDGVTDDATAFEAMRAAGGNSGVYELPAGRTFYLSRPFTLISNETVIGWGSTLKIANACPAGIVLGSASGIFSGTLKGLRITKEGTWNTGDVGISCLNAADAVFENLIVDRFEYGIHINPLVGARVAYCLWLHPEINRCRVNWRIIVDDTGFSAENKVVSGRLAMFSDAPVASQYNVHATRTGSGSISHWYWLSTSMESSAAAPGIASILLENVRDWVLESPRTEGTWTSGFDIQMDAASINNRVALDYTANVPVVSDLGSNIVAYRSFTKPIAYVVNSLPAAASWAGAEAYITNSLVSTIGTVVATGGTAKVKVMSNGTNWIITAAV